MWVLIGRPYWSCLSCARRRPVRSWLENVSELVVVTSTAVDLDSHVLTGFTESLSSVVAWRLVRPS